MWNLVYIMDEVDFECFHFHDYVGISDSDMDQTVLDCPHSATSRVAFSMSKNLHSSLYFLSECPCSALLYLVSPLTWAAGSIHLPSSQLSSAGHHGGHAGQCHQAGHHRCVLLGSLLPLELLIYISYLLVKLFKTGMYVYTVCPKSTVKK